MEREVASVVFSCVHLVCCLTALIFLINTYIKTMNEMRPPIPATSGRWQTVGGASHKFFVYSAYYDGRMKKQMIRIVGATKRHRSDPVFCILWYPNATSRVHGEIEIIKEHHDLEYAACFIKCFFDGRILPDSVSVIIITENQLRPENHLRVIDTKKYNKASKQTTQTSKTVGICVQPLHYTYHKTIQLVEFMELNRILGVKHVTFYNSSISPTTDCILRNYVVKGRASVLPWTTHFKPEVEILTENIIAALNDCLYRNMHNFSYLAFIDMDEFIMPAHDYTIQQMIVNLESHIENSTALETGSYGFRNAFFNLHWPEDQDTKSSNDVYERSLTTLFKTRRSMLFQHRVRSKYIAKPTKVQIVGNHFVWVFVPGYYGYAVGEKRGILNHYRLCDIGMNCTYDTSRIDRTALRYKAQLVAAVKRRWQELQKRCGIEDIQHGIITRPSIPATSDQWQTVGGASHKFSVYSAYYDGRMTKQMIRIIGATKRHRSDPVFCILWYPNATSRVHGEIEIIREHHGLDYAACFIKCFFDGRILPDSVSAVTENQLRPENHLRVIDTRTYNPASNWTTQASKTIGICVQPLHFTYNKTIQLVEFMELNRILGVKHFTFYNSSISPTTDCILRRYVGEGRASVLPWKDDFKSEVEILTENIIAALNDCLYRNMHNFSYLAFLDMDEFTMPAHDYTIQQMIDSKKVMRKFRNNLKYNAEPLEIGSYGFRSAFFNLHWPDDEYTKISSDVYERSLTTLLKTRRTMELLQPGDRAKYIIKPTKVQTVGNHFVWKFVPGYHGLVVGQDTGILNHYRLCDSSMIDHYNVTYNISHVDRTAFRYKARLVAAVKRRWQELQKKCGIEDIKHANFTRTERKSRMNICSKLHCGNTTGSTRGTP